MQLCLNICAKPKLKGAYIDRAIDAYARAYKLAYELKRVNYHKKLIELYKLRFNLVSEVEADGIKKYIEKLLSQPMPDPATPVVPVVEEPVEIKYIPNKSQ